MARRLCLRNLLTQSGGGLVEQRAFFGFAGLARGRVRPLDTPRIFFRSFLRQDIIHPTKSESMA